MDDYEEINVPNSPLDEYMKQYVELNTPHSVDEQQQPKQKKQEEVSTNEINMISTTLESLKDRFFYDHTFLRNLFTTKSATQILTSDDECYLHDEFLTHTIKRDLCRRASRLVILLAVASFFLFQFYAPLLLLLLFLQKYAFRFLFEMFLSEIYTHMSRTQNLFIYLKQIHLLKLSVATGGGEELNVKYRKLLFQYLRSEYYRLRECNLQLAEYLRNKKLKLMCTIEEKELTEVLKCDGDDEERLSNSYHLNVLNCLIKLNYLQLSESVKLVVLCFMQVDVLVFYKLMIKMLQMTSGFKAQNSSLNKIIDVCRLKVVDQVQTGTGKCTTVEKSSLKVHVNSLGLHLRNALLNSYKIVDGVDQEALLKTIEYELDFCVLYVKQIKNEKGEPATTDETPKLDERPTIVSTTECAKIDNNVKTDLDTYDTIFEALSNENTREVVVADEDDNDAQVKLEAREMQLLDSNFNIELRQALGKKQNEWSEREKQAIVIKDEKLVEYERQQQHELLINDENDLQRYKSQLRNRKRTSQARKYQYLDEDGENGEERKQSSSLFLNEFKAKFNVNEGSSNDDDDEIIYE